MSKGKVSGSTCLHIIISYFDRGTCRISSCNDECYKKDILTNFKISTQNCQCSNQLWKLIIGQTLQIRNMELWFLCNAFFHYEMYGYMFMVFRIWLSEECRINGQNNIQNENKQNKLRKAKRIGVNLPHNYI